MAKRAGFHLAAMLRQDEPDVQGLPSDSPIYVKLRLANGDWGYPSEWGLVGVGANQTPLLCATFYDRESGMFGGVTASRSRTGCA